ncbi:MAG: hypothetical protein QOE72_652 [Chloroflexota bacterium]|nr:hypothetical protein [Chloroflexota bacterium]
MRYAATLRQVPAEYAQVSVYFTGEPAASFAAPPHSSAPNAARQGSAGTTSTRTTSVAATARRTPAASRGQVPIIRPRHHGR